MSYLTVTAGTVTVPTRGRRLDHLTGIYDAGTAQLRLYVDGRLAGTATHQGRWNATGVLAVGRAKWNGAAVDFLPGHVDQVQVWGRALSDTDVRTLV